MASPKRSTSSASRTCARRPGRTSVSSSGAGTFPACAACRAGQYRPDQGPGKTTAKRLRAGLREVRDALFRRRHEPVPVLGAWLRRVVRGYMNYHAVPGSLPVCGRATARTGRRPAPPMPDSRAGQHGRRPCVPRASGPALAACSREPEPEEPLRLGTPWAAPRPLKSRARGFCPRTRATVSAPGTRGRSRMREYRSYGSARGAPGNRRPYRDWELHTCSAAGREAGGLVRRHPGEARRQGGSGARGFVKLNPTRVFNCIGAVPTPFDAGRAAAIMCLPAGATTN